MKQATVERPAATDEYRSKLLDVAKGWVPVFAILGTAAWSVYTYSDAQKNAEAARAVQAERDNLTRRIEAQKPFLQIQLATYLKTTALIGQMIQLEPRQERYKAMRKDFDALYWSELALVEDPNVSSAMVQLQSALFMHELGRPEAPVKGAAIGVAHAMRESIRNGWQASAPAADGNQK